MKTDTDFLQFSHYRSHLRYGTVKNGLAMGWGKISECFARTDILALPLRSKDQPCYYPSLTWTLSLRMKDVNLKLITHRCSVCVCRKKAVLPSWVWFHVSGQLYLYIYRYRAVGAEAE
jgi:hypothetical protein